jgi:hypothetical protein
VRRRLPHRRPLFGEEADFAAEIAKAEVLLLKRLQARVLSQHPEEVRGRHGIRSGRQGDRRGRDMHVEGWWRYLHSTTDGFGDFWFRGLAAGATYSLTIAAPGFATKSIDTISTKDDVNLGDIALAK